MVVELPEPEPVEPELEPLELPEPMLPLLEPELGAGVGVGLGDVVLLLLPLVPPAAPELEPDLLKWASHSEREIWPSLLVSTDEKVGAEALELVLLPADGAPLEDDGVLDDPLDMPDEPLELEPDAAGEDEDLSLLVLDDELWATATLESANSAAAVAALNIFRFNIG